MNGLPGNDYAMKKGTELPQGQAAHQARMAGVFELRTANLIEVLSKVPMNPDMRRRAEEEILRRTGWTDEEIQGRRERDQEGLRGAAIIETGGRGLTDAPGTPANFASTNFTLEPIESAIRLAERGLRVMWIDQIKAHDDVITRVRPLARSVNRTNGAQWVEFSSGGSIRLFSTSHRSWRGYSADVAFIADECRPHLEDLKPSLATSEMAAPCGPGPIYVLPTRLT